ncbi:MAG TPA: FxLYD domain-containing protein [Chthonomonadaceae bacterium]|nr:FxLYD domain-containing protein [Chthonomonadaceae bacterium]
MQCIECGYALMETDKVCPRCNTEVPTSQREHTVPTPSAVPDFDLTPQPAPGTAMPSGNGYMPPPNATAPTPPYSQPNSYMPPPYGGGSGYGVPPRRDYGAPPYYTPTPAAPSSRSSSAAWVVVILSVLGLFFLFFIGLVALVMFRASASRSDAYAAPSNPSSVTYRSGDSPSTLPSPSEESAPSSAGEPTTAGGTDSGGTAKGGDDEKSSAHITEGLELVKDDVQERENVNYIVGEVHNNTDHPINHVVVRYKLWDEKEKELGSISDSTDSIGPGETWHFEVRIDNENTDTYDLDSLEGD